MGNITIKAMHLLETAGMVNYDLQNVKNNPGKKDLNIQISFEFKENIPTHLVFSWKNNKHIMPIIPD
ncbi:MAG: hypothetical protein KKE44_20430 [Proteobacteria bacterium]|nr:hypothetical protein [Pseudomonadota bacterium]MBU1585100.1 hypothetical protein [Pseudomonadota bacterium]MBU2627562.1 hypothetical protein [Pseudomonadota bacterium]